jgi:hypothetical protein
MDVGGLTLNMSVRALLGQRSSLQPVPRRAATSLTTGDCLVPADLHNWARHCETVTDTGIATSVSYCYFAHSTGEGVPW